MPQLVITISLLLSSISSFGFNGILSTPLSPQEEKEISDRLQRFYHGGETKNAMNQKVEKFDLMTGQWTEPNPKMKATIPVGDPLLQSAGKKTMPQFLKSRCEHVFKKKFPFIECDTEKIWNFSSMDERETGQPIERLVSTWMESQEIIKNLSQIPVEAEVSQSIWSGDYWKMRWGLTSYRYSEAKYYSTYREAVDAYHQPAEWLTAVETLPPDKLSEKALSWSPSEKYDLLVGDENMTLTQEQKREGSYNLGEDGNVESWFGICHGWAPASFMVPTPETPVNTISARGTSVTWYPDDIRAMATLAWANGSFQTNFIGGRCNQKNPARYTNGRLSQPECFDNNPVSFHLALGNMIGVKRTPVIMDAAFDYQVWNQPILSYQYKYFNPLDIEKRGKEWQKFVVPYDDAFKSHDRFQTPLTRGRRLNSERYDDSQVKWVVGVIATVVYLAENSASHTPTPKRNSKVRVTYTYDLELESRNGSLIPTGGEWHENKHPDFLWVPEQGSTARLSYDSTPLNVNLGRSPEPLTTKTAGSASGSGYPLCQVLGAIVESSSSGKYRCSH